MYAIQLKRENKPPVYNKTPNGEVLVFPSYKEALEALCEDIRPDQHEFYDIVRYEVAQ